MDAMGPIGIAWPKLPKGGSMSGLEVLPLLLPLLLL
jgi:hypothetical protein